MLFRSRLTTAGAEQIAQGDRVGLHHRAIDASRETADMKGSSRDSAKNRPGSGLGSASSCYSGLDCTPVAQIFNLLYRRFVIGRALETYRCIVLARAPQNAILRYGRLQICATIEARQPASREPVGLLVGRGATTQGVVTIRRLAGGAGAAIAGGSGLRRPSYSSQAFVSSPDCRAASAVALTCCPSAGGW